MEPLLIKYSSKKRISLDMAQEFLREGINYFGWILYNSHGYMTKKGIEYLIWPADSEARGNDIVAYKSRKGIIFKHMPGHGGHNIMILTSTILYQAAQEYLNNRDNDAKEIINHYCKGITATMKGMVFGPDDNEKYIMARNIVPRSHIESIKERTKLIDYSVWRNEYSSWNAKRIHNKNNPFFGDIYVTTIRSKDDLPHILKTIPVLQKVSNETDDLTLKKSVDEMLNYMKGFCRKVVDCEFYIPTKDKNGNVTIPKGDLAHILREEPYGRAAISLVAGEDNIKLRDGGRMYERIATKMKYYNYKIFNTFHLSTIMLARMKGHIELEEEATIRFYRRLERLTKSRDKKRGIKGKDLANLLIQSKSIGIELSQEQEEIIREEVSKAMKSYICFNRWDLWDRSVKVGVYGSQGGYIPFDPEVMRIEELGNVLLLAI